MPTHDRLARQIASLQSVPCRNWRDRQKKARDLAKLEAKRRSRKGLDREYRLPF